MAAINRVMGQARVPHGRAASLANLEHQRSVAATNAQEQYVVARGDLSEALQILHLDAVYVRYQVTGAQTSLRGRAAILDFTNFDSTSVGRRGNAENRSCEPWVNVFAQYHLALRMTQFRPGG